MMSLMFLHINQHEDLTGRDKPKFKIEKEDKK